MICKTAGWSIAGILAWSLSSPTWGRPYQDLSPSTPLRGELPFSILPERLQGPPRAVGELPIGDTQPPSTLPGRVFGPPRASGEAPNRVLSPISPGAFRPPIPTRGAAPTTPGFSGVPSVSPLPRTSDNLFLSSPFAADILAPRENSENAPGGGGGAAEGTPAEPRNPGTVGPLRRGGLPPLTLDEVLDSAFRTYPPYLEVLQEFDIARGELLASVGGFDLNLNADARNWTLGYYKRYLYDVFFEQPTTLWGTKFFLGYRLGVGKWPVYYQYLETRQGGAYVGGLETPLLKGGRIDAKRAKLWQNQLELQKVQPLILKQRIDLVRLVTRAYVSWWSAAQAMALAEQITRVAIERDKGLARQVQLGSIAPIDRADSQRVVLSRQGQLVYARRRVQKAAIDLSLFLRDEQFLPWIPDDRKAPEKLSLPQPPPPEQLPEDIDVALRLRPELWSIRLLSQKAEIQRQFTVNQALPSLNFYLYSEQDFGGRVKDNQAANGPFTLETSLLLDVPLQRRTARGQIAVADAAIRQIRFQQRFAQDKIVAEVRDDFLAVQAAYQQMELYRQSADINRNLESAERRKFSLGNSTVLALALREQATFDAELYELEATAEFLRSVAEYRAALAVDVMAQGQPALVPPPAPPWPTLRQPEPLAAPIRPMNRAEAPKPGAAPGADRKPENTNPNAGEAGQDAPAPPTETAPARQ